MAASQDAERSVAARTSWARRLPLPLLATASYVAIQIVAAVTTGYFALFSGATHLWNEVIGLSVGLAAVWLMQNVSVTSRKGCAAAAKAVALLVTGLLLLAAAIYVVGEALRRLFQTSYDGLIGFPVLVAVILGLLVPLISLRMFTEGGKPLSTARNACLEILADIVGAASLTVAAIIVWITGWNLADVVVAILIALFVLPRTFNLLRAALVMMWKTSPASPDDSIISQLKAIEGVIDVHDLKIWNSEAGLRAVSVHLDIAYFKKDDRVLERAHAILMERGFIEISVQAEVEKIMCADRAL